MPFVFNALDAMPKKSTGHGHDSRYIRMQKNYRFACGNNNPDGMRLKFAYDEETESFICRFRLGKRYTGPRATPTAALLPPSLMRLWGRSTSCGT